MDFFPEPNSPEIAPFTQAFLRVMFAHVKFEHRVTELADVIRRNPGCGETKALVWSAKDRPKKFGKLCAENQSKHPGGLPEADTIVRCFDEAFPLCKDRNYLAHGVWWRFDANRIDVHAVRIRTDEPPSRGFTIEQMQRVAESFADVENELWGLQQAIEARLPAEPLPSRTSDPAA